MAQTAPSFDILIVFYIKKKRQLDSLTFNLFPSTLPNRMKSSEMNPVMIFVSYSVVLVLKKGNQNAFQSHAMHS